MGLEYLTLDRLASTLSGGEAQRIQLATSLGSRLVGTLYVLDEPSIGLHSRDTHRLIKILQDLRDLGNTILVVEHDPDIMRTADRILDLGPGAGENGGKLVAAGTYEEILQNPASLTGRYLSDDLRIQIPAVRRQPGAQQIRIKGVRANNLKGSTSAFRWECWWRSREFRDRENLRCCIRFFIRRWREAKKQQMTGGARRMRRRGRVWRATSLLTKWCWWINRRLGARRARIQ